MHALPVAAAQPLLEPAPTAIVAVVGACIAVLALVIAVGAQLRMRRIRRGLRVLRGHSGEGDVLEVATRHAAEVSLLREQVERQQAQLDRVSSDVAASLRHVAVVRFDAFGDMGGRLSFSAAVLDDAGDGLVLTSIHGRGETRSYAKGLLAGKAEHALSPEEAEAVSAATAELGAKR
ncbi:DUF4446 family protein [Angustibacter sp. McL0619]|uniref:DUF4446 family protein n=1 Tax=Angustibacter sp. McL0619 TaxID=3415676 RepID=UPI003CF9707E